MRQGWPVARAGMVVGLLGGSFDPAHEGHANITRAALARFGLDRVWWLVSPGNPLKSQGPAPLAERMERARQVMQHPRVQITDIEARLGTRYTARTLEKLMRLYPGVRFVWLMGADNLAQFHRWEDWQRIMRMVPVGVLARPGSQLRAGLSPAARCFARARLRGGEATMLGHHAAPAWCLVGLPMMATSSTEIRRRGEWGGAQRRP